MIEIARGDILRTEAEALVNTVNCVGVMGRGIALQFKRAYPENFKAYAAACKRGEVAPGRMFVFERGGFLSPKYIINFPTKRHWRGKSRMEDIEAGLVALVDEVRRRGIQSIAIPPLGSGLGELDWNEVRTKIETTLQRLPDVRVLLFEPTGTPAPERMVKGKRRPRMTVGRAALLGLMNRYLAAVMDPSVSLLEIHKLMYFLQEAGEPLRLRYTKAIYGPYAENLRHVLDAVEGHFVIGYGDGRDRPDTQIEIVPEAALAAEEFLKEHADSQRRFQRVGELIEGFETPFGIELLASVHWVATREGAGTPESARRLLYQWSPRKQMFTQHHIRAAWEALMEKGWAETDVPEPQPGGRVSRRAERA